MVRVLAITKMPFLKGNLVDVAKVVKILANIYWMGNFYANILENFFVN